MFDFKAQKERSILYKNIRNYFDSKDYLEVFTPTLAPSLIPEPTIKAFGTKFINEFTGNLDLYMIPSPEIFMKELLASGSPSIYQISSCFRNSEQLGDVHNPEFSMLEYYTLDFNDEDSLKLTVDMIERTAIKETDWLKNDPLIITVEDAMKEWAGIDLIKAQDIAYLRSEAERLSLLLPDKESWEDTFNRIFINFVEPNLPRDREVYLRDYPKQIECLAKDYSDKPYKMRWEMYIKGIEVANCYTEETDTEKIRSYYEREQQKMEAERAATGDVISKADIHFASFKQPEMSGVAIGLDRLLLTEYGKDEIEDVLLFPMKNML